MKGNLKDYPAILALGGVVHSLRMLRPWLEFARPERVAPTMHDPVSDLQEAQDRALWEMDEYDDGELVSTI